MKIKVDSHWDRIFPIMHYYTEVEHRDLLNILISRLSVTSTKAIDGNMAFTQEQWDRVYRGEAVTEYTSGIILVTISGVSGSIPIRVELSDIVKWITADRLGCVIKLPVIVYKAIYDVPHSLVMGKRITLPEASGDALIASLNANHYLENKNV